MVHFAVDDHEVWMCAELKDGKSWFLPFNIRWSIASNCTRTSPGRKEARADSSGKGARPA